MLFTGATASLRGGEGRPSPPRGWVRAAAQSLAREFGPQGIHVAHLVIDGGVDSPAIHQRRLARSPMTVAVHIPITKPLVGDAEAARVDAVLRSGWLTQGDETFAFERMVAERVGAGHGVATSSATTALHLGMVLLGIGPGDEVLVPSYSFIATANIVRYVGATPVFVDIRPDTWNIDEQKLEMAFTARTRAIVPVHQLGMPAEMEVITDFVGDHGLAILEDAACAIGSEYHGRSIGALGNVAVFSFHPRKVVTTGEGGMLITDDAETAERARSLASHGEAVIDVLGTTRRARGPRTSLNSGSTTA